MNEKFFAPDGFFFEHAELQVKSDMSKFWSFLDMF